MRHSVEKTVAEPTNVSTQETTQFSVMVVEQGLPEFLRQAARRDGYEITLTKRVRGTIRNLDLPLDMEKILRKIAGRFDLKWHMQGRQVFVSTGSETASRMIFLGAMKFTELQKAMQEAQVSADDYKLSHIEESNAVMVNGPSSYIGSIELLADSYNKKKKSSRSKVKVIRFGTVGN